MTIHLFSTDNASWTRGKKTKGLEAKPLSSIIADADIVSKFLINTPEGYEPVHLGSIFCIGETGDVWQQTPKALLKKYDITNIDGDGWMSCIPKPENEVEFFEFTAEMADAVKATLDSNQSVIQGLWGQTIEGVGTNLQFVKVGDFICRQPHQRDDQWVVQRKLFLNSYTELGGK